MTKSFPCWVCKGQGGEKEVVIEETGQGPWYECGYCEGEGLIEIGGTVHRKRKAEQLALEIVHFSKPEKEEWTNEELLEIGYKALNLV